mgnify:FL=1
MGKPTVHDIAREAGVSLATVDRVLNERPGVSRKTVEKVLAAGARLGYVRDTSAANLARQREYQFAFLLPEGPSQFIDAIHDGLLRASSSHTENRTAIDIHRVQQRDPHAIVGLLRHLQDEQIDGVALMVPETPQVRDAVNRLKDSGAAVVTLVSDLPNSRRDFFVGFDNVRAGRTAAFLLGRFLREPGEILVVTNSIHSRDSLERRFGFDTLIQSEFPWLQTLPSVEAYDDAERMSDIIKSVVATRNNLLGIYSVGYGNTALVEALRQHGDKKLTVVAHELTPVIIEALHRGEVTATITHNVAHLVSSTLRILRSLSDGLPIFNAQEQMRIEIITRENLPESVER